MNKLFIIGNLVRDPELRTTQSGINVCSFTVAVNRKKEAETDFFRVTAWRQLADICAKWLRKGKKACVVGSVSVNTYTGSDGATKASLEVTADDVEFLSPRDLSEAPEVPETKDKATGFTQVNFADADLPF